jgi:SAM-dependent methyltransferase
MFGSTLDYWLLRPFAHNRALKTEEQLNREEIAARSVNIDAATRRIDKLQNRVRGRFPIHANLRYLDVGCGAGDIALALKSMGAGSVTGVDMVPRYISAANANKNLLGIDDGVEFLCRDIINWEPVERYDVVLSHEALEHIREPWVFLRKLKQLVAPGGIAILAFGPLFYSPFGDHMNYFFKVPIPWKGALFSETAILRLRREFYRPTDRAIAYGDITGGLNLMRYSAFLRYAREEGWKFEFQDVNPQLRRIPPLYWLSNILTRTPGVRDYFAASVYATLRSV